MFKMATNSGSFRITWTLSLVLVVLLQVPLARAGPPPPKAAFCPLTLSKPKCPDLSTYDQFDVTTYGGRWFEIGSSANFKNLQEAGAICVVANYSLLDPPSPGKGAKVKVVNRAYSLGAPGRNVSQVGISIVAGQVCSQAFAICAEVDERSANSSLAEGLAHVAAVKRGIQADEPAVASSLAAAIVSIDSSVKDIRVALDGLAKSVSSVQKLSSRLGQGVANATAANVGALVTTISATNQSILAVFKAVAGIEEQRVGILKSAAKLLLKGELGDSAKLGEAAELILAGEGTVIEHVAKIQVGLASMTGLSALFLSPPTQVEGYTSSIVGTARQNATFAGKLAVKFPGFPPGQYWVLGVDGNATGGGYAATLVYGCDQSAEGGIEETLFILSRTPTLPEPAVQRLLAKAAASRVTGYCSTPFIRTVQSASCGNPPGIAPYY